MLMPREAKHLLAFRKEPIWFGMEVAYVFFIVQSPPKKIKLSCYHDSLHPECPEFADCCTGPGNSPV